MGSAVRGREGRILLGRVVLPERWTRLPFPFDPDVRWGTCFQVCFPFGRELGLVKHGHRILEGSSGSGGRQTRRWGGLHRRQDGGDRSLELRRERLTQELFPTRIGGDIRGHPWYSGGRAWHYSRGQSRWRKGDVEWEKCPRVIRTCWGWGTPNTRHRGSPRLGLLPYILDRDAYKWLQFAVNDPETFDQGVQFAKVRCREVRGVGRKITLDAPKSVYQIKE